MGLIRVHQFSRSSYLPIGALWFTEINEKLQAISERANCQALTKCCKDFNGTKSEERFVSNRTFGILGFRCIWEQQVRCLISRKSTHKEKLLIPGHPDQSVVLVSFHFPWQNRCGKQYKRRTFNCVHGFKGSGGGCLTWSGWACGVAEHHGRERAVEQGCSHNGARGKEATSRVPFALPSQTLRDCCWT